MRETNLICGSGRFVSSLMPTRSLIMRVAISARWQEHGYDGLAFVMTGSWDPQEFPNLIPNVYTQTSPATRKYNCIAWAAGDTSKKWWPDPFGIGKWPPNVPRQATLDAFILAFGTLGYVQCVDGSSEASFEKIALYATRELDGSLSPTHAAIQLPNGNWSSKLGDCEDIEHLTLEALNGNSYGHTTCYLKRPRR